MTRRSLFAFLAAAPVGLPAAITALEAERNRSVAVRIARFHLYSARVYLDGARVAEIVSGRLSGLPFISREGSAWAKIS